MTTNNAGVVIYKSNVDAIVQATYKKYGRGKYIRKAIELSFDNGNGNFNTKRKYERL